MHFLREMGISDTAYMFVTCFCCWVGQNLGGSGYGQTSWDVVELIPPALIPLLLTREDLAGNV